MKEYIEQEAIREYFHLGVDCNDCEQDARRCRYFDGITRMDICSAIDDIPAADVVEVRHGRWEPDEFWRNHDIDYCVCSSCQKYWIHNGDQYDFNYCPNCGAKMDGGADTDEPIHP